MKKEELHHYWQGKKPNVRKAVEEYMERKKAGEKVTQEEIAEKHQISAGSLCKHYHHFVEEGIAPEVIKRSYCCRCGADLYGKYPKIGLQLIPRSGTFSIQGYFCMACARQLNIVKNP